MNTCRCKLRVQRRTRWIDGSACWVVFRLCHPSAPLRVVDTWAEAITHARREAS